MAFGLSKSAQRTLVRLLAAAALVATVLGGFAACLFTVGLPGKQAATPKIGPVLDGTFKVDIGPTATPDGKPVPGTARTETWVARSACHDGGGCVATVAVVDPRKPGEPARDTLVFDYVGGDWLMVREAPDKCKVGDADVAVQGWTIMKLQSRIDGSLGGEYTWATAPALCANKRAINLTPSRGSDSATQPSDPATEPPLKSSRGAALRGTYVYTQTYPETGEVFPSHTYDATTFCLRTGDRCISLMTSPDTHNLFVMIYGDGRFTANFPDGDAHCTDGVGKVRQSSRDELPLPQGPQDPLLGLAGKSYQDYTGDCPAKVELDVKLERTGD
jgi:serine/threonine-protein kinase